MKIRRLHQNDLARITVMPLEQQYAELRKNKIAYPPYSYNPFRAKTLDILNVMAGPLAPSSLPRQPWDAIASTMRVKSAQERVANVAVGEGLYEFATAHNIRGRKEEFAPLLLGSSESVSYWSPVVIELERRAIVPFFDPRRTKGLTAKGRQFVFSVMNERIRMADPDYADVGLVIVRFDDTKMGARRVITYFADSVEMLDFDTLDHMVRRTYLAWYEVLAEREAARRKRGSGGEPFGLE